MHPRSVSTKLESSVFFGVQCQFYMSTLLLLIFFHVNLLPLSPDLLVVYLFCSSRSQNADLGPGTCPPPVASAVAQLRETSAMTKVEYERRIH